jgi:hypothetical protein
LDAALQERLPFGATLEKSATLERLYPAAAEAGIFTGSVPRLNRAIRIGSIDVLIGSVLVDQQDPLTAAREASSRISQAFWQYNHARAALHDVTGREVRTLGVVLNGASAQRPDVANAKEYVLHLWKDDVDELIAPRRQEDEPTIAEKVEELVS